MQSTMDGAGALSFGFEFESSDLEDQVMYMRANYEHMVGRCFIAWWKMDIESIRYEMIQDSRGVRGHNKMGRGGKRSPHVLLLT